MEVKFEGNIKEVKFQGNDAKIQKSLRSKLSQSPQLQH